jgi:hypothetical protein
MDEGKGRGMIIGLKNKRDEKILETKEGKEIKIWIACKGLIF